MGSAGRPSGAPDSDGCVLVLNSGSSSVKFALVEPQSGDPWLRAKPLPRPHSRQTKRLPEGRRSARLTRIGGTAGPGGAQLFHKLQVVSQARLAPAPGRRDRHRTRVVTIAQPPAVATT
jgi:hypothetical protein